MTTNPRPAPSIFRTAIKAFFIAIIAIAIGVFVRMWWPDSNKLAKHCDGGDVSGVKLCLRLGVDPNKPAQFGSANFDAQTPLTAAAQSGHIEVIRLLLAKGANPNLRDFGTEHPRETPLATAAMHGQLEECRVLLEAGADPNLPCMPKDPGEWGNWTALDWALQARHSDIADLLREHGAVVGHRGGRPPARPRPFP